MNVFKVGERFNGFKFFRRNYYIIFDFEYNNFKMVGLNVLKIFDQLKNGFVILFVLYNQYGKKLKDKNNLKKVKRYLYLS